MNNSCWYEKACVDKMNEFYDKYHKNNEVLKHLGYFTDLLARIDDDSENLIDVGCGTAQLSDFCKGYNYFGADLKHMILGCAMRNYPNHFYRACDITKDDLKWLYGFHVVVLNAVIDIMPNPTEIMAEILTHCSKWVIIHRQEITNNGTTKITKNGSYSGFTYHSIINRKEFDELVQKNGFRIIKQSTLSFGNWENGGHSFLLKRNTSYSLFDMDIKLLKYLGNIEGGTFIECGANDGLSQSVTMYYEHYLNWSGVLIEALPHLAGQCRENRSPKTFVENYALVSTEYNGDSIDLYSEDSSGLTATTDSKVYRGDSANKIKCPVNTLSNILDKYSDRFSHIDLMVLDTEGYEKEILKGFDFGKYRIDYILIEDRDNSGVRDVLSTYYDQIDQLSGHDFLFKRK